MLKALSVSMLRVGLARRSRIATAIADSSALFIVCRSRWDTTLIRMTSSSSSSCPGKATAAPSVGLPWIKDPSVYAKARLSHIGAWSRMASGALSLPVGVSGSPTSSVGDRGIAWGRSGPYLVVLSIVLTLGGLQEMHTWIFTPYMRDSVVLNDFLASTACIVSSVFPLATRYRLRLYFGILW